MKRVLLILTVFVVCSSVKAEIGRGKFGIGLNYPGLGIRYFLSNKNSLELKGQYETDIFIGGLRGYYYFNPKAKYLLFTGLEIDYISFKGDLSEGDGIASELFVGGEYFFVKKLSLQLDLGPAFIFLRDKDTSVSVDGLELVVNFGINYYFGKK